MKKLFILTLLVFSTAISVFATHCLLKTNKEHSFFRPPIKAHIIFASPRSGCENFPGICVLVSMKLSAVTPNKGNEADGTIYFENGILYLEIPKNQMGSNAKNGFINLAVLPVDADLTLDDSTITALQSSTQITILQGKYPIRDNGTSYSIAINCR